MRGSEKTKCPLTVARNFNWEEPKMEKSCDVSLVTFFSVT